MKTKQDMKKLKENVKKILKENKIKRAGIFGSYARNEQKKDSDVDIVIEVKEKKFSLLDLIGLEMKLAKILKKKVDLLTYNGLNPYLKERIMEEEVRVI